MNFFEVQDLFKSMHPGKNITFEFDEKCHRFHELVYTDGVPNVIHHVENHKVKVTIEGMDSIYVPISPHRENCSWSNIKDIVNSKQDVFIHNEQIKALNDLKNNSEHEYKKAISQLCEMTGLSEDKLTKKMDV